MKQIHIFTYKLDSIEKTDINIDVNVHISKYRMQW